MAAPFLLPHSFYYSHIKTTTNKTTLAFSTKDHFRRPGEEEPSPSSWASMMNTFFMHAGQTNHNLASNESAFLITYRPTEPDPTTKLFKNVH